MTEEYVLDLVMRIVGENDVVSNDVSMREIYSAVMKDLKETLNGLVKKGVLVFHRQLNDVSFNLRKE